MNLLKSTANSIIGQYPESPFICVVEGDTNKEDIEEMKKICPVFIGKSTFSSLRTASTRARADKPTQKWSWS
jgi:hypothetical protein